MDYSIVWAESALEDLRELVRYIAADNPAAAERFGNAIIALLEVLASFPRTGRIVPELRDDLVREVILAPYRIVYELADDSLRVSIVRVWHGARGELEI